jgi:hypothetical protein
LATQRVTIAKVGGDASDVIVSKLRGWAAARASNSEYEWSGDQWPAHVRDHVDDFAEQIRSRATALPVVHFVEWIDSWSMFPDFEHWLTPPDGPVPIRLVANRYHVYGIVLPDGGRLKAHLKGAGKQQYPESDWYVRRLREAVAAWEKLVDKAILVVLRWPFDGSRTDEEIRDSLSEVPDWLSS